MTAQPKCPVCEAVGLGKIADVSSTAKAPGNMSMYFIVCCTDCGHVYGIVPQLVRTMDYVPTQHPKYMTPPK